MSEPFEKSYFETAYRDYERQNSPKKMEFYRRLVCTVTKSIAKPRILEIGCAFGKFLSTLDPNWDLYGIDVSEYALNQARKRLPEVQLLSCSATEIPFEEKFDIIAAFDVIEHIADLQQLAETISSRLILSGRFIFVVPVYDGPIGLIVRHLDKDPTHLHKASRNFWLTWANLHFYVEQWYGILRYLLPWGSYIHWSSQLARRWTPPIAVIARKKGNVSESV